MLKHNLRLPASNAMGRQFNCRPDCCGSHAERGSRNAISARDHLALLLTDDGVAADGADFSFVFSFSFAALTALSANCIPP